MRRGDLPVVVNFGDQEREVAVDASELLFETESGVALAAGTSHPAPRTPAASSADLSETPQQVSRHCGRVSYRSRAARTWPMWPSAQSLRSSTTLCSGTRGR